MREPFALGALPAGRVMRTLDAQVVAAPLSTIFDLAREVEHWPRYLPHYRFVTFRERTRDGGGVVEMSANRPFGPFDWPTWWLSEMAVDREVPWVRFRHIGGTTRRMDVEWSFRPLDGGRTAVEVLHVWNGPAWPLIGRFAARRVIGPVFVHGIASRTLAGLARAAEASSGPAGSLVTPIRGGA